MSPGRISYRERARAVGKGAVAGMIGGLAAAAVMGGVMSVASHFVRADARSEQHPDGPEPQETGSATEQQKRGSPPQEVAQAISRELAGRELQAGAMKAGGHLVHYAFGASVGALYGAAAEVYPSVSAGAGLPFGAVVWAGADELATPLVGLSNPPMQIPLAVHVVALAAHLVYGLCTEAIRRTIRMRR